jgi:hypothetical protein
VGLAVVALVAFGGTTAAALVGARIGRNFHPQLTESARTQLFGIEASVVGVLALLLGFSFAMSVERYELRRKLVLDEANAIGTSWLRTASVGDEEAGAEIRQLLSQYVDSRLAIVRAGTAADRHALLEQSERLERQIWSRAAALAREDPRSIPAGLLLQSLNDMIDLNTLRIGAARNHVPGIVLVALVVVAMLAMGWVGAGVSASGRRGTATLLILAAMITFVITVIVDLDQPRIGLIRVSQAAMIDLQHTLRLHDPAAP